MDVTSSMGEVVEGPVEADDPDDVDNVPMFSGMFILLVECLPVAHSDAKREESLKQWKMVDDTLLVLNFVILG